MKVFINPGHAPNGIPDPGAVNPNNGARESDFTWAAEQARGLGDSIAGEIRGLLQKKKETMK